MVLKTNYKDYQFQEGETLRKYRQISNNDGTISLEDVTSYKQEGDRFSASDINSTNAKVNELDQDVSGLQTDVSGLQTDVSKIQGNTVNDSPDNLYVPNKATIYSIPYTNKTNAPIAGGYFSYITFSHSPNFGVQIAIDRSTTPKIFARRYGNGAWSNWVQYGAMSYDSSTNTLNITM